MANSTSTEWQIATYMGDNDGEKNLILEGGGRQINFGRLTKGQRVNVPVSLIDGATFVTDAQLVEGFAKPKRTRRKKDAT